MSASRDPSVVRTASQKVGDAAEAMVAASLEQGGWQILATHLRIVRDELDLVAIDPGPPPALVVIEVRSRSSRDFGLPEETVDGRKRARVRRAGFRMRELAAFPNGAPVPQLPLRFDLIVLEPGRPPRHHRGAL